MFAVTTPATLGRRTCAVLAAASAALHAVMLGHAANPAMAVLMAAMIGACLYCARDLWLRGTLQTWCIVAVMNLAMVAVHLPVPAHRHVAGAASAEQQSTDHGAGDGAVAGRGGRRRRGAVVPHPRAPSFSDRPVR